LGSRVVYKHKKGHEFISTLNISNTQVTARPKLWQCDIRRTVATGHKQQNFYGISHLQFAYDILAIFI